MTDDEHDEIEMAHLARLRAEAEVSDLTTLLRLAESSVSLLRADLDSTRAELETFAAFHRAKTDALALELRRLRAAGALALVDVDLHAQSVDGPRCVGRACAGGDPMTITTILLLPHAETRERLLAPGAPVWLAHPAATEQGWTVGTIGIDAFDEDGDPLCCWDGDEPGYARAAYVHLVLAREGAVVPDGVMRAWFEADDVLYDEKSGLSDALYGSVDDLIEAVSSWRRNGAPLGTLLLLDEAGDVVGG